MPGTACITPAGGVALQVPGQGAHNDLPAQPQAVGQPNANHCAGALALQCEFDDEGAALRVAFLQVHGVDARILEKRAVMAPLSPEG